MAKGTVTLCREEIKGDESKDRLISFRTKTCLGNGGTRSTRRSYFYKADSMPNVVLNSKSVICPINACYKIKLK